MLSISGISLNQPKFGAVIGLGWRSIAPLLSEVRKRHVYEPGEITPEEAEAIKWKLLERYRADNNDPAANMDFVVVPEKIRPNVGGQIRTYAVLVTGENLGEPVTSQLLNTHSGTRLNIPGSDPRLYHRLKQLKEQGA